MRAPGCWRATCIATIGIEVMEGLGRIERRGPTALRETADVEGVTPNRIVGEMVATIGIADASGNTVVAPIAPNAIPL